MKLPILQVSEKFRALLNRKFVIEKVREVLECRKVIECLQIEIIELQNHIDGNGLFLKDFFKDTYFELFAEEDNAIEKGCATEKKQKQYDPF